MCTTRMARVRAVMRLSICATSMHHVAGSLSTSTGTPPARTTAAAHEMMVNVGRITSSPGWRARHSTAMSSAVVPLVTATPCATPQYAAHPFSNRSRYSPAEEIQPERKAAVRLARSRSSSSGSLTGIIEGDLVVALDVRTLFHFEEHSVFAHAESVSAADKQHQVARRERSRGHAPLRLVVDVDLAQPFAHHDRLHRDA